ncbi:hypothetical protein CBR_g45299, partial [Chara braunii]
LFFCFMQCRTTAPSVQGSLWSLMLISCSHVQAERNNNLLLCATGTRLCRRASANAASTWECRRASADVASEW